MSTLAFFPSPELFHAVPPSERLAATVCAGQEGAPPPEKLGDPIFELFDRRKVRTETLIFLNVELRGFGEDVGGFSGEECRRRPLIDRSALGFLGADCPQ